MSDENAAKTFQSQLLIRDVAERYFFAVDTHDAATVAQCFAQGGVFRSATQTEMHETGRTAIEAAFRSYARRGQTCHLIASMNITMAESDAVSQLFAISYVTGAAREGHPVLVRGLKYSDKWMIEDDHWVLRERVHEALWQFQETLIGTQLPTV